MIYTILILFVALHADGYSDPGTIMVGETLKEARWTLNKMKEALKKPILYYGDRFPEEYKP